MVIMTSPSPVWLLTWLYSPNREGEVVGERRKRGGGGEKREGGNKKRGGGGGKREGGKE